MRPTKACKPPNLFARRTARRASTRGHRDTKSAACHRTKLIRIITRMGFGHRVGDPHPSVRPGKTDIGWAGGNVAHELRGHRGALARPCNILGGAFGATDWATRRSLIALAAWAWCEGDGHAITYLEGASAFWGGDVFGQRGGYKPTSGDRRFRDAKLGDGPKSDSFETARLLQGVSHEYLSVLAASNSGDASKPFRIQIEAEVARRNAQRATRLAVGSLIVAVVSLLISGAGLLHTFDQGLEGNAAQTRLEIVASPPPIATKPSAEPAVKYPRYLTSIPKAFRGR